MRILEQELETQRESVRVQTERLKELRTHFDALTMKTIITEKENEKLIYKLASMTLQIQNLQDTIQGKESDYKFLDNRCQKLLVENEELRKSKKQLTKEIKEKDAEASRVNRLKNFFNITKAETEANKSSNFTKLLKMT